jgi:hypothetical protein
MVVIFLHVLSCLVITISRIVAAMVNLTAATATSSLGMICPQATIRCSAVDFPSVLLWFLNDEAIAQYTFPLVGDMDEYPFHPTMSAQFTSLLEIIIVEASQSNNGHHFLSTMRTNLSALREAGVTNVSCGNVGTKETYALNFNISKFVRV